MRKISLIGVILVLFMITTVVPLTAQRGDDANRKSKNGKVEGTIDGVKVTLEYGRPNVNKRKIWGVLVPYEKVWRTGANEATTFIVSKDVMVEGKKLAAGTYGLFTIPGEAEWTIIFNSVAKQWGSGRYDKGKDALRVKVKPKSIKHVEEMTFHIKENMVVLAWEKLAVPFTVKAVK